MSDIRNKIYVGNLPNDVKEEDIDNLFGKYGRIRNIEIRSSSNGISYCFVAYEHPDDAEEAIDRRDGYNYNGHRIKVEKTNEKRTFNRDSYSTSGDRRFNKGAVHPTKTRYRVKVENLPPRTSWQDLKDFMRKCGDVGFCNVTYDTGVVDYMEAEGMERALSELDDTKFRDKTRIRIVKEDVKSDDELGVVTIPKRRKYRSSSRSDSRSRSRSRNRSYSRSHSRSRKHSHKSHSRPKSYGSSRKSYSRSPIRTRSPIRSRSRS